MFFRFRSGWCRILSPSKEREDLIFDPVPPSHSGESTTIRFTAVDRQFSLWTSIIWLNLTEFYAPIWSSLSFLLALPPSTVPKNNIFMPSSLCQSPTGNSDSEPGKNQPSFQSFSRNYKDLNLNTVSEPATMLRMSSINRIWSLMATSVRTEKLWYLICNSGRAFDQWDFTVGGATNQDAI